MHNVGLVDDHSVMFTVKHYPSGDTAEADDMDSAVFAAHTLIQESQPSIGFPRGGFCEIHYAGRRLDTVARTAEGSWLHSRSAKS